MPQTVYVQGLDDLVRTFIRMDMELGRDIQREIKEVAGIVSDDARSRAGRFGASVSGKIRPRARGASGYVESSARSKHIRPDFGSLLMRTSFIPALESKEHEVVQGIEHMLDRLAARNGF